jgi:hypothetical protein
MDLCLIRLFALQNAIRLTIITATLLLGVAMVHKYMRSNFSPLINYISCNITTENDLPPSPQKPGKFVV